jgi:hypothetical protein
MVNGKAGRRKQLKFQEFTSFHFRFAAKKVHSGIEIFIRSTSTLHQIFLSHHNGTSAQIL